MIVYTFYAPAQNLTEYISTYAILNLDKGKTDNLHAPPNGFAGFIINIDRDENGKMDVKDYKGNAFAYQQNYVVGQTTQPCVGNVQGKLVFLIVFFKPVGLHYFFGTNMDILTNKTVDLFDFLGNERAASLISNLNSNNDIDIQINCLNNFFTKINNTHNIDYTQKAITLIEATHGNISIKDVEEKLCINRRTLERHFKIQVGISPKVYAQIFRFKCAMHFLKANPTATWAQITYENGFSDQSHLIKYFKEYLKVSPNNLVTLDNDFINYMLQ